MEIKDPALLFHNCKTPEMTGELEENSHQIHTFPFIQSNQKNEKEYNQQSDN